MKFATQKKRTIRKRKIPTDTSLKAAALHHLSRYASSEAGLRRVLENRIRRAAYDNPDFAEDKEAQAALAQTIEAIITKHRSIGSLNDETFAISKTSSFRRAGQSARQIKNKLKEKGIKSNLIEAALVHIDETENNHINQEEADIKAAHILARRKKIGPYRAKKEETPEETRKQRNKEYGVFARAGFSGSIIRKIINTDFDDLTDDISSDFIT